MKRASLPLAALACAALLACHAGVGGHLSEADKDAIRKVTDEAGQALAPPASDAQAYARLYYAEDARVLPPNVGTITGREAIAAFLGSFGALQKFQATILTVEGRNDLAYVHGAYEMSVLPPGESEPVGDKGKYVCIWKKQSDGSWKVALDIWNSDLAAPASPPPAASGPTLPAHD
jgi:uncharacterized protein (TIGR02246 family)